MYRIALKNVGKDMVNKEFTVDTFFMTYAVDKAFTVCQDIIREGKELHFNVVGEEIAIMVHNDIVGSLSITKLN